LRRDVIIFVEGLKKKKMEKKGRQPALGKNKTGVLAGERDGDLVKGRWDSQGFGFVKRTNGI